ncbi:hypothetical protein J5N97_029855 [Dioscorea zingiberensis]|uniref:K Homology domain-containing protein n=1 Tax=Dioscorea zingiberensis TaxID=325984 RepID=A0A9D5H3K5_9LILI|nr:hypothetical protein J5N97_029855 [Dioscorea zingiberensis]
MVVRVKRSGNVWMAMLVKIVVFVVLGLQAMVEKEYHQLDCHHLLVDGQQAEEMSAAVLNLIASADVSHIDKAFHAGFVQVGVLIGKSGETINNLQINSGG